MLDRSQGDSLFRSFLETVPHIVWFCNTKAELEFVSGHWQAYTGLPADETGLGQGYQRVMHPDDFGPTLQAVKKAAELRIPLSVRHRLRRADGVYRWNHAKGNPVFNDRGELRGWVGTSTDIDDEMRAQQLLVEANQRVDSARREAEANARQLRHITDAQPFMIAYVDREYRYRFVNKASETWFGLSASKMVGFRVADVIGEGNFQKRKAEFDRAFAGEALTVERPLALSGRERFLRVSLIPDRAANGSINGVFVTLVDITEAKETERTIRESEARFRSLADAMPQIVWTATPKGQINYINQRFYEYTGLTAEEAANGGWSKAFHEGDLEIALRTWHDAIKTGRTSDTEFRIRRGTDGMYRWHLARAVPIRDKDGTIVKWYGTNTDIHDVKLMSESLKAAQQAAEAASAAKSTFLANMSHEIRTPMTAVLGFTEILKDPSVSTIERQDAIARIESSGRALLKVIDDILDISKLESGKFSIQKIRFSPREVCEDVVAILRMAAEQKSVVLKCKVEDSVPQWARGDPGRIRQVLLNLVGNAVKFTSVGEIELLARAEQSRILAFDVCDTGIGISADDRAKLFQPFAQADVSITRKFGGTGLGLLLSLRLAEQMGGRLELVRSVLGEGSRFRFRLDAAPFETAASVREANATGVTAAPGRETSLDGLRVLLAEDVADNQMLMRRYLARTGVQLQIVPNGEEAVDLALKDPPDLVLMDIQMPKLDGIQATKRLRAAGFKAPILALTAHAMAEEVTRSFNAGCNAHLIKPITKSVLIDAIREHAKRQA
jgi:PAS domain S-box-containing protein